MPKRKIHRTEAQEARAAIERLYITMRHLFMRGSYKPLGVSGESMIEALQTLQPEIYGSLNDPERVELDGLFYVFQRLPKGIEECRFVRLISREGFEKSDFEPIIASRRRRHAYRIDAEQIFIEMTRGRSDIYDILTHLTFMYNESEKIRINSEDHKGRKKRDWHMLEKIIQKEEIGEDFNLEVAFTYLSTLLGRTYEETVEACKRFSKEPEVNSIFRITYWLGRLSTEEAEQNQDREITFSSALRERVGHHQYGEEWARYIKEKLRDLHLIEREIHIISANLHSVMNSLFAKAALARQRPEGDLMTLAEELSLDKGNGLGQKVMDYALKHGMYLVEDTSGTSIQVQLFDLEKVPLARLPEELLPDPDYLKSRKPVLLVMDYAFGEQAFEIMDELLKPLNDGKITPLKVESISIMGKAGILEGEKGDIMVPTAHIFEGTADNYPLDNQFRCEDFEGKGLMVIAGPMVTVLGTSLQNRKILAFFRHSSWKAIGLEMEGAHYQKAIQAASKIRKSIREDVTLRYAYYASDNPLVSGNTLASGSLGKEGVYPTYLITLKILNQILHPVRETSG